MGFLRPGLFLHEEIPAGAGMGEDDTMLITSRQNQVIQHTRKLLQSRSFRQQTGQFAAEGTKLLAEAAAWYDELELVIAVEGLALPQLPQGVRELRVSRELMAWLSQQGSPQGALFVGRMPEKQPLTLRPGCLILDGIQDPGNLGTILRTADALEVPVVLSDGCADAWSAKTLRAAMGAVFRNPPQSARREEILAACRQQDIPLAVTALSPRAVDIRAAPLQQWAVVIGSEGRGVCAEYFQAAEQQLIIPMNERCESLNAAVAATIVLWQMKR